MSANIAAGNIRFISITVAALIVISPTLSFARGAGGHAGGHAHFSHTAKTNPNSNGPASSDRDTGHARAEDRMSQNGLAHNNAGIADTDSTKPATTP